MSDILKEICDTKREHIARCKAALPASALMDRACVSPPARGFFKALEKKSATGIALIAEIKKASPSKGLIREDFHPGQIAQSYARGGATCLSVLTDIPYFQGHNDFLVEARTACNLPVLRKDFMLDDYQVTEARAIGADCILLIMAALSDAQAADLEDAAFDLGMDVLVEVHDARELERALVSLSSPLIGINNRNLKTLEIDLETSARLRALVPQDYVVVCESGIHSHADIQSMQAANLHCFLVGESLMLQRNIEEATRQLLGAPL